MSVSKTPFLILISLLVSLGLIMSASQGQKAIDNLLNSGNVGYTYCPWYYQGGNAGGPPRYGWLVNGTLIEIQYPQANKFFDDCGGKILAYSLWNAIPKHSLLMNDLTMMFAHVQSGAENLESDTFLIINGTKWPIMGGMNQTLSTGVKAEMVAMTTVAFLDSYPTGMYLSQPY